MPTDGPSSVVLQIAEEVTIEQTALGAVLETPAGNRVSVTGIESNALLAFASPKSIRRVLAMARSDEERSTLSDKVSYWIDLGVLRVSHTTHGSTPVAIRTNAECRNVFFVYAGTQGGMMMNPLKFLQESGLSNQNVVLLQDPSQTWFLNGVGDEIKSFRELIAWQSGFLAAVPQSKSHYCIGSSMGAFSAVVFGHMLKARSVWTFGLARTRVPVLDEQGETWDLYSLLSEWNGVSRYYLYFNEASQRDREAALRLAHLPGVELCPQGGEGHLVLEHLLRIGKLAGLFRPTSSGEPANGIPSTIADETEVLNVLRSVMPRHSDALDTTTNLTGLLDSFGLVSLLERLATDLGVDLDPARLTPADFESASSIAKAIARQRNAANLPM